MNPRLENVKALAFDIGGTVFDWHHTVRDEVAALARAQGVEIDAPAFANDWRRRQFQLLAEVRAGSRPWTNARRTLSPGPGRNPGR